MTTPPTPGSRPPSGGALRSAPGGALRPASARRAEPRDRDAVDALRAAALDEQDLLRGGALYRRREARSLDDAGALWVGELDDTVIGYLAGRIETLAGGETHGVVDALYVDPPCRAVGVGEALMGMALEWFRAAGCSGVDALALPGARSTKNFFEESGFTSRLLVMHHRL